MFCQKCGNELPNGAKFCSHCGARADSFTEKPMETGKNISSNPQFKPEHKKSFKLPMKLKWWQVGLVAVWALAVITVIMAVMGNGSKKKTHIDASSDFNISSSTNSVSSTESNFTPEAEQVISSLAVSSRESKPEKVSDDSTPGTAPSVTETKPAEPQDIPFNYDDISEAIRALDCYSSNGVACSHFADENDYINEFWNRLNDDQKEWATYIYKSDCCNSVSKAKAHYSKYFSTQFIQAHPFDTNKFIENGGKLYFIEGAVGSVEYEFARPDLPIRRVAYNKLTVNVLRLTSVDDEYVTVYLEYQDGFYKIVSVDE